MDTPGTIEQRRAPRVPAELLVRIAGIDSAYVPATGNLSTTGLMLELPTAPGAPGDLEQLHVSSVDRAVEVVVLAQIVRCVTLADMTLAAPRVAVAFQFFPSSDAERSRINALLTHILDKGRQQDGFALHHRFPVDVDTPPEAAPRSATVFRLHVQRMVLETTWPANIGDRVQLAFNAAGTRLPFEGLVTKVQPRSDRPPPCYEVDVELGEVGRRVVSPTDPMRSMTESIDLVLSDLLASEPPTPEPTQRHLSGRLERIGLTSLLTFLEMERQTGRLHLDGDLLEVELFIDGGRIVDVEPAPDGPHAQLEAALELTAGRFAFSCESIDREDRVKQSTTHLLLDWARRSDEAAS